jgi:hypothetical protein
MPSDTIAPQMLSSRTSTRLAARPTIRSTKSGEAAGRPVDELAREENEVIIGVLRLRADGVGAPSAANHRKQTA